MTCTYHNFCFILGNPDTFLKEDPQSHLGACKLNNSILKFYLA